MNTSGTELSVTEWAVLGILAEGTTHGFAIAREFTLAGSVGPIWTIPRPLVYRAISTLKDHDYAKPAGSSPGAAGPQRALLKISRSGQAALDKWLDEPIAHVRDARTHFIIKLLLLDRSHKSSALLVKRQREMLVPIIAGLESGLHGAEGFDAILRNWRLCSAQAFDVFLGQLQSKG